MKIFSFKSKPILLILTSFGCIFILLSTFFLRSMSEKKTSPLQKNPSYPNENKESASFIELNDAIITRLILENLPDNIPFSNLVVHISEDSEVKADCEIRRKNLIDFINEKKTNIPPYVKFITNLLPDSVPISLNLRLAVDSKQSLLTLSPQSITVDNTELSSSIFPAELEISINNAINSFLTDKEKKIESITLSDGHIRVYLSDSQTK